MTNTPQIGVHFSDLPRLNTPALLKKYGLRPDKNLGQNFLEDPIALEKIASEAEIEKSDTVLEIGPGLGNLTRYLSIAASEVVAVELDQKLIPILRETLGSYSNIRLVQGNILKLDPEKIGLPRNYLVAANIPYNITSAILRHLLESELKPRRIVLTVQEEIAERICGKPPDMSLLALSVQVYGTPSISAHIPARAFFPAPDVNSAVVRIDILPAPRIPVRAHGNFFRFVKAGFSQRRKTLRNSLSGGLRISTKQAESLLASAGIDPSRRAETLNIEEWGSLSARGTKSE
jgi:16S rRNA (adenine1518-N6/adenine1519-N6)-dimethyltransferase